MNFEFWKECKNQDVQIQKYYEELSEVLLQAENCYWEQPVECAMHLQDAAVIICKVYNRFFGLDFPEDAKLSERLCYNGDDVHDAKVSHFLCAVRDDQRNELNLIRALGDDCVFLKEHPEHRDAQADKMYLDVKKMMIAMMDCLKHVLILVDGRSDVEELGFDEDEVPGEPPQKPQAPARERKSFWKKFKK